MVKRSEIPGLFPRAKPSREEDQLQMAIIDNLSARGNPNVIWYHIPNQGYRGAGYGAKLKAMGVRSGVPDLAFVLEDGSAAFLELKSSTGDVSREQMDFAKKCFRMGVKHEFARDIDTALSILTEWGVIRPNRSTIPARTGETYGR